MLGLVVGCGLGIPAAAFGVETPTPTPTQTPTPTPSPTPGQTIPARVSPIAWTGAAYVNAWLSPIQADWVDGTDGAEIVVEYSYLRCDTAGANCGVVPGATLPNYPVNEADVGFTIRARERARNSVGTSEYETSEPSAVVQYGLPFAYGPLELFGTPIVGEKIGAYNGGWSGSTSYYESYLRCDPQGASCVVIPGASDWTYTVQSADVGHTLRVEMYAVNGIGTSEVQRSPASAVVVPGTQPTPTPTPTPTATPTDAPPLSAPPVFGVTPPVPTPTPAPRPPAGPVGPIELRSTTLRLTALTIDRRAGRRCPATVEVTVRAGGLKSARSLRASASKKGCVVTGAIKLKGRLARATKVSVTITGTGVKTVKQTVARG